jgi:predicted HTH transcriptional regulator
MRANRLCTLDSRVCISNRGSKLRYYVTDVLTVKPEIYLDRKGTPSAVETERHVRVCSSNRQADKELFAELKRFGSGDSYDEEPLPNLDSEAIDFRAASESFASIA